MVEDDAPAIPASVLAEPRLEGESLKDEVARTLQECGVIEEELELNVREIDAGDDGTNRVGESAPYRTSIIRCPGDLCVLSAPLR